MPHDQAEMAQNPSRETAVAISGELSYGHVLGSFRAVPTDTGGYFVDIAKLSFGGRKSYFLQLWLDEWTHGLRLYYGLSTTEQKLIRKLADSKAGQIRPVATFYGRDIDLKGGQWRLIEPLPQTKLNQPIAEIYNWSFY